MRVLVTGATGFLGGTLCRTLNTQGYDVVGLGRDAAKLAALADCGISTVSMDLVDKGRSLPDNIGAVDAMVHCAALSSPWGKYAAFLRANVVGTETAIRLAHALGVRRFVNISSPTVYFAMRDQEGVTETMPLPRPINAYGATKALAEMMVLKQQELGPVSLRPRGIYGSGDTALLPRLLEAAKRGPLPILRGGVAAIDLTHVSDVVRAIEAALLTSSDAEGEVFNVSGGEQLRVRYIVERTAGRAGVPIRWRPVPLGPAKVAAHVLDVASRVAPWGREPRVTPYALGLFAYRQSLNIEKAQDRLGWAPKIRFDQGLDETFSGWAT